MSKIWYGAVAENGDFSNGALKFPVIPNKNILLKAVRVWVVVYGSPTMTGLKMKLKTKVGTSQGQTISTSTNSWNASQLKTDSYAIKEIYFEFNSPAMNSLDEYYFDYDVTTYSGDDSNHIAFIKAIDPVYATDATISMAKISELPYMVSIVGADL